MRYNTRIAPSPTGPVHLGTMRTAYFNWLAARSSGGKFTVRIDDTDQERSAQKWADQFIHSLEWIGLNWDALEYQSERLDIYHACADSLVHMGLAKRNVNQVQLTLEKLPNVAYWTDELAGEIPVHQDNVLGFETMTIIKPDGYPTYHFASCVDDIDLDINHVIRGVDHITNTAKHVLLYDILNSPLPKYTHVGLLRTKDGKLSKRDAASNFQTYIDQAYDPDAVLNFLARLGWGPTIDDKTTKLLPKEKMVDLFLHGGQMKNKDAVLNFDTLESYNRKYKGRKASGEMV